MKTSESTKEIAKKMALFRKNMLKNQPSKEGKSHYGNYVTLESLTAAIDGSLPDGLGYTQDVTSVENGVSVSTMVVDASGEFITYGPLLMPVQRQDAQAFGSAETYARRYSLSAAFGVSATPDDDGEQAANNAPKQGWNKRPQQSQNTNSKPQTSKPSKPVQTNAGKLKTIGLLLATIAKLKNTTVEKLAPVFQEKMHVNFEHLTDKQSDEVIMVLTRQQNKIKAEQKPAPDVDELTEALDEASAQNLKDAEAEPAGAK